MKVASLHRETESFCSGSSKQPREMILGRIYSPICQIRKLSLRKVKRLVHGILANVGVLIGAIKKKIFNKNNNPHVSEMGSF